MAMQLREIFKMIYVFEFTLQLAKPISTDKSVTTRKGLILSRHGSNNRIVWSEVSPLPGHHLETLEEAKAQLLAGECRCPSLQMGLDLLDWQLERQESPDMKHVELRALYDGNRDNLESWVAWVLTQGYKGIKIKVGRQSIERDIDVIQTIRRMVGPQFEITLDANRIFDLRQAIEFAKACERFHIHYIEEPVQNPDDIVAFYQATKMKVALDESLRNGDIPSVIEGVTTWVIHPSLIGGLKRLQDLCAEAKKIGVNIVFSSMFESKIGISLWMQLAAVYGTPGVAHGLDTLPWFKDDLSGDNCLRIQQ